MNNIYRHKAFWMLVILIVMIAMPDILINGSHHIAVFLFESFELMLDRIVEHLFHTSRHATQIIVFYLMWGMFLYALYRFAGYSKTVYTQLRQAIIKNWYQTKEQVIIAWDAASLLSKLKVIATGLTVGITSFAFLMM